MFNRRITKTKMGAARQLALAAIAFTLGLCSAAVAQQTATEGVFQGRGIIKAVDPVSGALTLAHDAIKGLAPALETTYRVRASDVSECLRPGDTVDFTIDTTDVILGVSLLNYEQ
jgi:Cu/Ag efflux protein CusF